MIIKEIAANIFYALFAEIFTAIFTILIKDNTKKIAVLILGTFFASMVGFGDVLFSALGINILSTNNDCKAWNLAFDFRTYPNQENPNRDSCGNQDLWYFLESPSLERIPSSYSLLPYFVANAFGIPGYQQWQGSHAWSNSPNINFPSVGVNTTSATKTIYTAVHPSKSIAVHPWSTEGLVIVGWRSPINGNVAISGFVNDLDSFHGGDGILWFIEKGDITLASGAIFDGGDEPFLDSDDSENLENVTIKKGEFIYFIIHPNTDDLYDTTWVDIQMTRQ